MIESVAMPPILCKASRRKTALVPQQKARSQASRDARIASYHSRSLSCITSERPRLSWNTSALKKCCGVCTMVTRGSAKKKPTVR